ncbi:MAG: LamG-like jellyroll fold domain-containing protein [Patescibacteria group bacterium]
MKILTNLLQAYKRLAKYLLIVLGICVPLIYLFQNLNTQKAEAAWFDDSYAYRVKFTFTHNADIFADRAVTYTLDTAELIAANLMQSDCDDTRFTDGNGKPLLYDLTGTCNNASTTYEVIFPSIVNGSNLAYVYYGNPSAVNAEINSAGYTALTPSSGDPPAQTAPTANDELGPGPIAYWNFDEGTGQTLNNAVASNALNGTLGATSSGASDDPTWKTEDMCVNQKCLELDGSNDFANVTETVSVDFTTAMTVSAWIKGNTWQSTSPNINGIVDKASSSYTTGYVLRIGDTGLAGKPQFVVGTSVGAGEERVTAPTAIDTNRWYFVAGTFDGSMMRLYIDGILVASQANSNPSVANNEAVKIGFNFNGRYFDGFIDEVKLYNYARSANQLKADFTARGLSKGAAAQLGNPDLGKTLSNGLVGYWKMDETSWTNNCTASDVLDSSGNNLHGKSCPNTTGPTGGTTGKFGKGGTFDGSNDYIDVGDQSTLELTTFTLSAWIYRSGACATFSICYIISKGESGNTGYGLRIKDYSGTHKASLSIKDQLQDVSGTSTIGTNTWYHIAATIDGSRVRVYVNGILETDTAQTQIPNFAGESFKIGNGMTNSDIPMLGNLDEVRVYNHAMTPAEVAALYSFAPGPVGWWKMDENTGTAANDSSGNGNTGTLTAGPIWSSGKFGPGITFDGIDDYVDVISGSGLISFSISLWIKTTETDSNATFWRNPTLFGKANTTSNSGDFGIITSSGNIGFWSGLTAGDASYISSKSVNNDSWYHIAVSNNGSNATLYVNGVPEGTTLATGTALNSETFWIGAKGGSEEPGKYHDGTIDDVRFYNYARTPKQIIEDMNAGHPAGGSPVGSYVSRWKFDDMTGTTAQDTTDNNNDLTLSGASWTPSGKFDGAWNGTGALWASRADDADFDFSATEDLTVSMWFKSDTADITSTEYLLNKSLSGGTTEPGYALYITASDTVCFGIDDDSTWNPDVESCSTTDVYDTNWHHVVGVRNVTTDKTYLYVDGYPHDNDTDTTTATLANGRILYVGDRQGADGGDEFNGDIDDVKVYRSALTADEVKIDYNAGSAAAFGDLDDHDEEGFSLPNPDAWWKFDENTGTTTVDSSGIGSTGTLGSGTETPVWTGGKNGSGLMFDGSDDEVVVGDINTLDVGASDSITISAWVRRTGNTPFGNAMYVVDKHNLSNNVGYSLELASPGGTCNTAGSSLDFICFNIVDSTPDQYTITSNSTITADSQWHHVVATFDRSSESNSLIYIDGVVQAVTRNGTFANIGDASTTYGICLGHDTTSAGGCGSSNNNTFKGSLDDIRIYKSVLTPTQIVYLYSRGAPIGHYKFDECQGTTAYNSAVNSNGQAAGINGTIVIGSGGSEATIGDCTTSSTSWFNGATGKYSSSIDLDGTDDYAQVASPNLPTGDFSYSVWVNIDSGAPSSKILLANDGVTSGANEFALSFSTTANTINVDIDNPVTETLNGTVPITEGLWTHLVTTRSGSTVKLYINGVQDPATASDGTILSFSTCYLMIGTDDDSATPCARATLNDFFDGKIDDLKIYNYPLTDTQIKTLYNQGSAVRFGPQTGSP